MPRASVLAAVQVLFVIWQVEMEIMNNTNSQKHVQMSERRLPKVQNHIHIFLVLEMHDILAWERRYKICTFESLTTLLWVMSRRK